VSIFEKIKDTKVFTIKKDEDESDARCIWKCYSCGIDSEAGGFSTVKQWTDYGYEYDCVCDTCGSEHTGEDGEGTPECDCGALDWYCDKCRKTMCQECWTWFDTPGGEPEEYLCKKCDP
jgi:hypothetical protein